MFIDSHCHLDRLEVADEFTSIHQQILATQNAGVEYMLNIAIDKNNWHTVTSIASAHKKIFCAVGVHPDSQDTKTITIDELLNIAKHPKAIAIGETGLDYFHKQIDKKYQQASFRRHIQVAIKQQMPLVIHTRDAKLDTIKILQDESAEKVGGILHCFTEDLSMAEQVLAMGFYISFSGILTFKNAKELQEVAAAIPLERLLIETDSPYLAPTPFRGKPNQPLYVKYVAQTLADIKQCSIENIANTTNNNFFKLFKKPLADKQLLV